MTPKPTLPEVLPLIRAVYGREGGGGGCCLHILTEDGNVENSHVHFCLERAREQNHADCIAAAEMLLKMTKTQRTKVYRSEFG